MPRYQPFGEHTQAARTVFPLGWSGLVPTYIKLSTTNENKPLNGVRGTGLRVYVCACVCVGSLCCDARAAFFIAYFAAPKPKKQTQLHFVTFYGSTQKAAAEICMA